MSGYQSGNENISSLITSGNTTINNSYNGFPSYTSTNNNWENPSTLGYQVSGTDIANSIQAVYTDYTSNNTFTPPSWCNTLKIIAIGGGGGGGSGGANKDVNNDNNNDGYRAGSGGSGGGGGLGIVINSGYQQSSAKYTITFSGGGTGGDYQNTPGDGGNSGNTGTNITITANGNGFMTNVGNINVYGGGGGGGGPGTSNNNNDSNGGSASSTGGIYNYSNNIGTTNASFVSGNAGNGGANAFIGSSGVVENYNTNNEPPVLNSNIDYSSNGNAVQNNNTDISNVSNPPTGQGGVGGWNSNNNNGYEGQNGGPALVRVYYMV